MSATNVLVDLAIRYGFQVLGAAVLVVVGLVIARWAGTAVDGWLARRAMEPPMRILIVRAVRILVLLFVLVIALDKLGFQIAPFVAGIGVAGLGIGFALQGVLSNLVAGLSIIFTKPFRVGEHISVLNVNGVVSSIELFSTTLLHPDHSRIVIPNRKIVGEILHNFGTMKQIHLMLTIPHTTDLERVFKLVHEVLDGNRSVLRDPAALVGIAQITDDVTRIGVHPWVPVADEITAEIEIYRAIADGFRTQGLPVGAPAREIRLLGTTTTGLVVAALALLLTAAPAAAQLGDFLKGLPQLPQVPGTSVTGLSDAKIGAGLKQALEVGTSNAVSLTGRVDGYFANQAIKILMPEKLRSLDRGLRMVGFGPQLDEFVLSMNRAAERAAPSARSIFLDAIQAMTFDDVRKILGGNETAATDYFKGKTTTPLTKAFQPIVSSAMNEVGVTRQYKDLVGRAQTIPFLSLEDFDLDRYVTGKSLDGLFVVVADEERKIRKDPAARVTDLLKEVFGSKTR